MLPPVLDIDSVVVGDKKSQQKMTGQIGILTAITFTIIFVSLSPKLQSTFYYLQWPRTHQSAEQADFRQSQQEGYHLMVYKNGYTEPRYQ